eukprot:TRINITY_DN66334_c0_g1_i1.p1 TRINITY_DN66334_c0_g1~~TRINITY_DN66334_c0_g1_i1.p1  ORF type:complete len:280 (+),score=32.68 TRINITY_DN66334_c0_g1_i1:58-840(+)
MPVEPQAIAKDAAICAISWTGGKDCNLALLEAWRDPSLLVSALVCFRPENANFRAHPLALMEAQAAALGLPLHHVIIPRGADYKASYVSGMRHLREEHGITVIATGDMDLVGTMARNWIEECGEEAGVRAFLPLWQADRASCLRKLIDEGFKVVFSCVKSPWFDGSWIGRELDAKAFAAMEAMASAPVGDDGKLPLDLGGERGEYHTMCLDGPLFSTSVTIACDEAVELVDQAGQKEGERWWVVNLKQPTDTPVVKHDSH